VRERLHAGTCCVGFALGDALMVSEPFGSADIQAEQNSAGPCSAGQDRCTAEQSSAERSGAELVQSSAAQRGTLQISAVQCSAAQRRVKQSSRHVRTVSRNDVWFPSITTGRPLPTEPLPRACSARGGAAAP
jgi:hypothetical protein